MQKPRWKQIANLSWLSLEASLPLPQIYEMNNAEIDSSAQSQGQWGKQRMDRMVDREGKLCRATTGVKRVISDATSFWQHLDHFKAEDLCARGGGSCSGCWKPIHRKGKMCPRKKEKPWEDLGNAEPPRSCCLMCWFSEPCISLEGTGQVMPFEKVLRPLEIPQPHQ